MVVFKGTEVVVIAFPSPHFKPGICHRIVWEWLGDARRRLQPAAWLVVDGKQDMALGIFEGAGMACINEVPSAEAPYGTTCMNTMQVDKLQSLTRVLSSA